MNKQFKEVRLFLLTILLIIFNLSVRAQADMEKGIQFVQGLNWEQIISKAKKEHKYIFVDCYATWCGPCKEMDHTVYTNDTVGNYYNSHFIAVKLQMDKAKSDNAEVRSHYTEAEEINKKYGIKVLPTFLFFSPEGKILHKAGSFTQTSDFIQLGKDVSDPSKQYFTMLERYRQHQLDTTETKQFQHLLKGMGEDQLAHQVANEFINGLEDDQLYTPQHLMLMYTSTESPNDRGFKVFSQNPDKVAKINTWITLERSKNLVTQILYNKEIKPFISNGKPDWQKINVRMALYGNLGKETLRMFRPGLVYSEKIEPALMNGQNWQKIHMLIIAQHLGEREKEVVIRSVRYYDDLYNTNLERHDKDTSITNLMNAEKEYVRLAGKEANPDLLNNWAWFIVQHSKNKNYMQMALEWSQLACQQVPTDAALADTYANLLFKLGQSAEAVTAEKHALSLEPGNKDIQANLDRMQSSSHLN